MTGRRSTDTVLVTGAFGLIGSATVRRLIADGRQCVVTGRCSAAGRRAARALPAGVNVRWSDLTRPGEAERLVHETSPTAIIHLAGSSPPWMYRDAVASRKINVDATAALVHAAQRMSHPPRFVHASSTAVYGVRNPHRCSDLLRADTVPKPYDAYGRQKLEAETAVRASSLEWTILRLGAVLSVEPPAASLDLDALFFDRSLPADGRTQTVDVRDAAAAFTAATTADVAGTIMLVGGDPSHRLRQGEIGSAIATEYGFASGLPAGRPGNPDIDEGWFTTDWMDTVEAQRRLSFQHHSWPDMLAEIRDRIGWKRLPTRLLTPIVRPLLRRRLTMRTAGPGRYADPWEAARIRFGDPITRG
ncbi:oxidoreductase [Mycobacterium sp. 1081908.1]|nr:NAD(P)-dependent oxidoreductase [Mycobacterium sp. 1081908.1]OBK43671.1 oxidoreductase [Mycobacterium sp. 1081908.1]